MPVSAYRVCRAIYARLDGEGSRAVGGRWNSPGRPVVYMAQSIALAVLENLVHMSRQDYPTGYVIVEVIIPDHVRVLDYAKLVDVEAPDRVSELQTGDGWLARGESAVLRVPSFVAPREWNYLINPKHLDFAQIKIEVPVPMQFDVRLFGSSEQKALWLSAGRGLRTIYESFTSGSAVSAASTSLASASVNS